MEVEDTLEDTLVATPEPMEDAVAMVLSCGSFLKVWYSIRHTNEFALTFVLNVVTL